MWVLNLGLDDFWNENTGSAYGHRSSGTNTRSWKFAEDKFGQFDNLPQAALDFGTQLRTG